MTIIEQIKTELERRIALYSSLSENTVNPNRIDEDRQILSFLSTLEPEKPLGLEEEIERKYANDTTTLRTRSQYAELARYFYDLGCRRTAEKYDELEYERQRTEELEKPMNQENSHEAEVNAALRKIDEEFLKQLSEKPMNQEELVEEVKRYYSDNFAYISSDQLTLSILTNVARHFAKWGAEHLKK